MTGYALLEIVHLLAAALYAGASFVNGLQEIRSQRSGDVAMAVAALRFAGQNNRVFLVPATFVLPATGLGMAWLQQLPLLSSWILAPLVLFSFLTLLLVYSIRLEDRLCSLAEEALAEGRPLDGRFQRLAQRAGLAGGTATLAILTMFVLMVLRRQFF